jgi:hypothetical protein
MGVSLWYADLHDIGDHNASVAMAWGATHTSCTEPGGGLLISHSFSPTEIPLPFNCFSDLRQAPTAALARSDSVSLPIAIPYRYDPTRLRKLDIGFVRSLLRVVTRVVVAVSP